MCGICGILNHPELKPLHLAQVRCMNDGLAHRGPDAEGFWHAGAMALGHRRLSIIDLSSEANQPLINEDESVVAVINGEIYNFAELRKKLQAKGHRFRSQTDSEVILHLYEERGLQFLDELRGMFALALWDRREKRLCLARDRVGKKPLYYAWRNGTLWFASEFQALCRILPWPLEVNLAAIDQYLTLQYVPAPLTAFKEVNKLPAAHLLIMGPNEQAPILKRYWQLSFVPSPPISKKQAIAEVRSLLDEAVALRKIADVPLGAFLSGGIDSSSIVALLSRHLSRGIKTFSVGFPESDSDETHYARLVARRYNTDHQELIITPQMVTILPTLVRLYGEPFADPSAVPTYYLSQFARQQVTVIVSGDGGDEGFAGYTRYWLEAMACDMNQLPRPALTIIAATLGHLPGSSFRLAREFACHLQLPAAERYLFFIAHFTQRDKERIVGPALLECSRKKLAIDEFNRILQASDATDVVNRLLDLDLQTYLPDDILTKVDIASMAHALEVRAPLLDHVLLERLARLPGTLKLAHYRGKQILRWAVRELLPPPILRRTKKGFSLPLNRWMREDLAPMSRELLTDHSAKTRGLFKPPGVQQLLDEHQAGYNHGERLWNLLVLELWFRNFVDDNSWRMASGWTT